MSKEKKKTKNKERAEPKMRIRSWLCSDAAFEVLASDGYTRLSDCPEIIAGVMRIAELVGSMTIHLMQNTDNGDVRVKNELSRKIDINPYNRATRSQFIQWIIKTLYLDGNGNVIVWPKTRNGLIEDLLPVTPSMCNLMPNGVWDYTVQIAGTEFQPDDVLHFTLNPSIDYPWKGEGYRVAIKDVADRIKQAGTTEKGFMESKWKPSLIVKVDADSESFSTKAGRKKILEEYVEASEVGEPWVLPAEQFQVEQVKPLSLADLAIADMVQIDKRTAAAILNIPPFALGVGEFKRDEWNNFVNTKIKSLALMLQQEFTKKLLINPEWYFRFSARSLYNYDLKDMAAIADDQYIRGIMSGNEVRDWIGMTPRDGLDDLIILENYIPRGMIGDQKKLVQNGGEE